MIGGSPSLARSRLMVILTVVVNGSAVSSHTRSSSSSAGDGLAVGGEQALEHGELLGAERQAPSGADATRRAGSRLEVAVAPGSAAAAAPGRRASARIRATSSANSNGLGR